MENYLGQIQTFAFQFAPLGWAPCNGQLLSISQNSALFALIGISYGGDGQSTFAVPNLQGRVMLCQGQQPGLPAYSIGQAGGAANATLTQANMPAHTHPLMAVNGASTSSTPAGNLMASAAGVDSESNAVTVTVYAPAGSMTAMSLASIGQAGGSQPFSTLPPYLAVNVCIAIQGIFPSRS